VNLKRRWRGDQASLSHAFTTSKSSGKRTCRSGLRLKCGIDVFAYRERKYNTWGELQKENLAEVHRQRDAATHQCLLNIAERRAKEEEMEVRNNRLAKTVQQMSSDSLLFFDRMSDVESAMSRGHVEAVMTDLGCEMPSLCDEEDVASPDESKSAMF